MAADTERTLLKGRSPRYQINSAGWTPMFVGIVFVAIGLAIVALSLDIGIHLPDSSFHAPRGVVAGFGGLFAAAGLLVFVRAMFFLFRDARHDRRLYDDPDRPWLADYPWRPDGIADQTGRSIAGIFVGLAIWLAFLAPFHAFAWTAREPRIGLLRGGLCVFDLVGLIILIVGVYLLLRRARFGTSRMTFARLPFRPGEELAATFSNPRAGRLGRVVATLRCIEEAAGAGGGSDGPQTLCYQLWADSAGVQVDASGKAAIRFMLPAGEEWGTRLSARPPRYWELELSARLPGVNFRAAFLVPVYADAPARDAEA